MMATVMTSLEFKLAPCKGCIHCVIVSATRHKISSKSWMLIQTG